MLDRTQSPTFKAIEAIELTSIKKEVLENGLSMFTAGFAEQEVLKIELIFNAGSAFEKKKGISSLFSKTLLGGTKTKTGSQIMEGFDQYGGFVELSSRVERFHVTLYGIPRFIDKYLVLLKDILENATFPQKEIDLQRKLAIQGLKLNLEKSTFIASRSFKKLIFGENNPYGKILEEHDLEQVSRADLKAFYEENVMGRAFKMFLSGKVSEKEERAVKEAFGQSSYTQPASIDLVYPEMDNVDKMLIERTDKMQSTIRLGMPLFDRKHPDFFRMMVANTAFGGYFGSRLMKNIREDKGFTYGISSSMTPLNGFGYLLLGSDVVKENTVATFNEIEKEMKTLQQEPLDMEELEAVKNYMCGSFAGSMTTAFEVMDKHKNLLINELDVSFYNNFIASINDVNAEDIVEMANQYLQIDKMHEVVVGERI